jgi:hypothetical protein
MLSAPHTLVWKESLLTQYALTSKNISGEIIDDELIVIDLSRGVYFTSKGAALQLWRGVVSGNNIEELVEQLGSKADDPAIFKQMSIEWLNALTSEGILQEAEGEETIIPIGLLETEEFSKIAPPTFEIHHDLEDILLFDPVHDFDELGWPKQPMR